MARQQAPRSLLRPGGATGAIDRAPGRRRRAPQRPPPPAPRVANSSRSEKSPALELEEDLAAQAVTEGQVDERQNGDQNGQGKPGARHRDEEDRRDAEKHPAQALSKVVRLRPVLHRLRLDDAARLENLEVELLEQSQPRHERSEQ